MSSISIQTKISDIEASLSQHGYIVGMEKLWTDEFDHTVYDFFLPQYLAALQMFAYFFAGPKKSWCHLAAEMQAGKTGVICTLIRIMLANHKKLFIGPKDVYILTGMSDTAWKKQTKERMPHELLRNNVQHSGGLKKVRTQLIKKASLEGGLKNVLIALDESHIAARHNNRPANEIFNTLKSLCPIEKWAENNIRFITISATDASAIIGMVDSKEFSKLIRLTTSPDYQSVEDLKNVGRLHATYDLVDERDVKKLLDFVTATYGNNPHYHIIRPRTIKHSYVGSTIKKLFPGAHIINWDSTPIVKVSNGEDSSSVSTEDINETLVNEPQVHTFIILKNMFYASKTLHDTYVGVMHDRHTDKVDTTLQSLLGRACGYGKSKTSHIFTEMQIVDEYIRFWRDLSNTENIIVPSQLILQPNLNRIGGQLIVDPRRALPSSVGGAAIPTIIHEPRVILNEDDFVSEWSEWFATEADAMKWWKEHGGRPQKLKTDAEGFLLCSTSGKPIRQRIAAIEVLRSGKKTAAMPSASTLESGKSQCRRYVAYEDITNKNTARFCVHYIKRK